jgi:hypothetical protein
VTWLHQLGTGEAGVAAGFIPLARRLKRTHSLSVMANGMELGFDGLTVSLPPDFDA